MRKSSIALAAVSVAAIAAAGIVRFAITPGQEQVVSGTDTKVVSTGTMDLLDTKALASGDLLHAFAKGVPFTSTEEVKTAALHGGSAVMSDTTSTSVAGAAPSTTKYLWSVNRKSLEPGPDATGTTAHQGLAIGLPVHPGAHDYTLWDTTTQNTVSAHYAASQTHAGRATYKYTSSVTGAVKDPQLLATLPPAVPKTLLQGLAAAMLSKDQQTALASALPAGDTVPLTYTAVDTQTFWADQSTGATIDGTSTQTVTAQMAGPAGAIPLTAVLTVNGHMTPDAVKAAAHQADSDATKMMLGETVVPIALLVLAAVLIALAVWLEARGRRPRAGGAVATEVAAAGSEV